MNTKNVNNLKEPDVKEMVSMMNYNNGPDYDTAESLRAAVPESNLGNPMNWRREFSTVTPQWPILRDDDMDYSHGLPKPITLSDHFKSKTPNLRTKAVTSNPTETTIFATRSFGRTVTQEIMPPDLLRDKLMLDEDLV